MNVTKVSMEVLPYRSLPCEVIFHDLGNLELCPPQIRWVTTSYEMFKGGNYLSWWVRRCSVVFIV